MKSDRLYKPIKESREWYFIEYYPPINDAKFAHLQLIILGEVNKSIIINAMEKELQSWLNKYPIPLMVSAFDNQGDLIKISEVKPFDHLIGFFDQNNKICTYWKALKEEEIPDTTKNIEYVESLFSNFVYKTTTDYDTERKKRRQKIKLGWIIFFIWLVVIPAIIALLDYYCNLVSLIALLYSLSMAIKKGLELTGKWPKTKRDKEKELESQLKDHYYYHCQMNPVGFNRLKSENFARMAKEDIAKEAKELKRSKGNS
jgi:hypothetical protein